MNLKRRFDGFLSEEHIKQQLIALAILLVASFFLFWLWAAVFYPGEYTWQEILAFYLDPGVFDAHNEDSHPGFRLFITGIGIFVFTAMLITVFTNVFSNISEAYKKGERRYRSLSGHTLILGANRMLIGMLSELKHDGSDNDILIVTSSPVEMLRDKIEAFFGDKKFMKRITFYYDERDNAANLVDARAKYAREVFIIGEDDEVDHDSVSISCCEKLQEVCKESPAPVHCFLVLDSQSSAEIFHYHKVLFSQETNLMVDVIDLNEYVAEQTLLGLNGDDENDPELSIDGRGIKPGSDRAVHFVISGMTPMAKAMARTAALLCHFPTFDPATGARRTVISFIDHDIKRKRDMFVSEHQNLFLLSHYTDISFDAAGMPIVVRHRPDPAYGDFLDIEWEFIDADISSPEAKAYLTEAAADGTRQLSVAICQDSQEDNMSAALHLPLPLYDKSKDIPIYVHLWEQGNAITKANKTGQFGNIYCFGTGTSADKDPLFKKRLSRGQRVNYIYWSMGDPSPMFSPEKSAKWWYNCKESDKFSSIYCANSLKIKQNSFGEDLTAIGVPLCEVEHRRWVLSVLLLGQKAYPADEREALKAIVRKECARYPGKKKGDKLENGEMVSPMWAELRKRAKSTFYHIDIDTFEGLVDDEEREKDEVLMLQSDFILGKTDTIKR